MFDSKKAQKKLRAYVERHQQTIAIKADIILEHFIPHVVNPKKLQRVMAVQALSRLNRSAPHLGKKTEDLFILDFFNRVEEIQAAFDDFYTATSLSKATDDIVRRFNERWFQG
ncbi:MAG: hypothetical protein U5K27_09665 [Desulfotignum sp.]|nr:hypothetical protein [Desulfotignum sp.]